MKKPALLCMLYCMFFLSLYSQARASSWCGDYALPHELPYTLYGPNQSITYTDFYAVCSPDGHWRTSYTNPNPAFIPEHTPFLYYYNGQNSIYDYSSSRQVDHIGTVIISENFISENSIPAEFCFTAQNGNIITSVDLMTNDIEITPAYHQNKNCLSGTYSKWTVLVAANYIFNKSEFVYPINDIEYSNCPVDVGTRFDPENAATWYTMVWAGKYEGQAENRCESTGGHPGVDILPRTPDSKIVRSIGNGTIVESNSGGGFGNYVIIEHQDDKFGTFYSVYAHLKDGTALKQIGEEVLAGTQIGIMGKSGTKGVHLHFQIDKNLHEKYDDSGVFLRYKPYWPTYTIIKKNGKAVVKVYPSPDDSTLSPEQLAEASEKVKENTYNPIDFINQLNDNQVPCNKEHNINASVYNDDGGFVMPSGAVKICDGKDITFSFQSYNQYCILYDVKVDNFSIGSQIEYTFSDVISDHTIVGYFACPM